MTDARETTQVYTLTGADYSVATWCEHDAWRWGLYYQGDTVSAGTSDTYHEAVHAAASALAYRWVLGQGE